MTAASDQVIQAVAGLLAETIREADLLGRYGGEEFALILPDVGDRALVIAERLREAVAGAAILTDAGPVPVTISVGVAHFSELDHDAETLLAAADRSLYLAKNNGRNQVVLQDEGRQTPEMYRPPAR